MVSLATEIDHLIDELYTDKAGLIHPIKGCQQLLTSTQQGVLSHVDGISKLIAKQKEALHEMEAETVKVFLENKKMRAKIEAAHADPSALLMDDDHLPGSVRPDGPDTAAGGGEAAPESASGGAQILSIVPGSLGSNKPATPKIHPSNSEAENHEPMKRSMTMEVDESGMVFAGMDIDRLKQQVKQNLFVPKKEVTDYYKKEGIAQRVARSQIFEFITMGVIGLNAIWLWIDTDFNLAPTLLEAHPVFIVIENLFCVFFVFEWAVRFGAFALKRDCVRDPWFVFDSALVALMVFETWIIIIVFAIVGSAGRTGAAGLRVLRLLRLTRMARMARLVRGMPELLVLVKAMGVALRSVGFALLLLLVIVYIYAILFTQILDGKNKSPGTLAHDQFRTITQSMNTLLLNGAFPDQKDIIEGVLMDSWIFYVLMLSFMLLAGLTVMNMLVGILCEVISVVSAMEKEERKLIAVKNKLVRIMEATQTDADGNGTIGKIEFKDLLLNPTWIKTLDDVGVDVASMADFEDVIFMEDESGEAKELSFAEFMDIILSLRGSNNATVKDIVELRRSIGQEVRVVTDKVAALADQISHAVRKS